MLFLQIVGALCLAVLAVLAILALWLWLKFRSVKKLLGDLGQFTLDSMASPARIHVERTDDSCRTAPVGIAPAEQGTPDGAPATVAEPYCQEFLYLGFEDRGTWMIREMSSTRFAGFRHVEKCISGAVMMLEGFGVTAEVIADFPSGAQINVTNSRRSENATTREGKRNIHMQGAPVAQLLERLEAEIAAHGEAPFDRWGGDVKRAMEEVFATDMDARIARWVDEAEIRRIATADGKTATEEEIRGTVEAMEETYRRMATEACRDNFLRSGTVSAADWEVYSDDIIVVHERQTREETRGLFTSNAGTREGDALKVSEGGATLPPLDQFAAWCSAVQPPIYRLLGTVEKPVRAHVYAGNLQRTQGFCDRTCRT